ncbi:hypothetical protein D3C81_2154890 [compost metagenome]
MPWPISSRLLLWRLPDMPSATTADNSDSIAPSMAITKAGRSSSLIRSQVMTGKWKLGSVFGMSP